MRERYGLNPHGQSVLQARRLVERGVPLVTVFWPSDGIKNVSVYWDTHSRNFIDLKTRLMPPADQAFSALLDDLAERGMLDETLVVWTGEFGRTPRVGQRNSDAGAGRDGRDHWPGCFTTVLAGGGIRGGQVYGSSDRHAAYPASNPVAPVDLVATVYHLLGVPEHLALPDDPQGRPLIVCPGTPIRELLGLGAAHRAGHQLPSVSSDDAAINSRSARRSFQLGELLVLGGFGERVALEVQPQERGEVLLPSASALAAATSGSRSAILLRSMSSMLCGGCLVAGVMSSTALSLSFSTLSRAMFAQRRDVDDLVLGQIERRQPRQPGQRRQLAIWFSARYRAESLVIAAERLQQANLVARQVQVLQLVQFHQRHEVGDLVLRQRSAIAGWPGLDRGQVGDFVVRQVEQQQVGALLQAGQVLDCRPLASSVEILRRSSSVSSSALFFFSNTRARSAASRFLSGNCTARAGGRSRTARRRPAARARGEARGLRMHGNSLVWRGRAVGGHGTLAVPEERLF